MKIKQVVDDFIVEEILDLNSLSLKDIEEGKKYHYFIFSKTNYSQMKALHKIANIFGVSGKNIHFAGTKDKFGVTRQYISIVGIKESNLEKNIEFFNSNVQDMSLEYVGVFPRRLNLGDNQGNRFRIVVRDLSGNELVDAKKKIYEIEKEGVLNFFDSQRFGYAGNSHVVGKYVLQNNLELAVFEILTSLPENPTEDLSRFVLYVKENFEKIKSQDCESIDQTIKLAPKFLSSEKEILSHLKLYKNDFPGAFRRIHKKLRTLYVAAYQSYIFNEVIRELNSKNKVKGYEKLELVHSEIELDPTVKQIVEDILKKDNLSIESFNLSSMPELKPISSRREVKIFPKNIEFSEEKEDDLNHGKIKVTVSFDLGSGEYATNVIKHLF